MWSSARPVRGIRLFIGARCGYPAKQLPLYIMRVCVSVSVCVYALLARTACYAHCPRVSDTMGAGVRQQLLLTADKAARLRQIRVKSRGPCDWQSPPSNPSYPGGFARGALLPDWPVSTAAR